MRADGGFDVKLDDIVVAVGSIVGRRANGGFR